MNVILISTLGFVIVIIIAILIHHAITHDGVFFDMKDFTDALLNMSKSHESIILLLIIVSVALVI